MGRAPRTKETLPVFREKCRVTRHSRVFRRLTGSQRTPGFGASQLCSSEDSHPQSQEKRCCDRVQRLRLPLLIPAFLLLFSLSSFSLIIRPMIGGSVLSFFFVFPISDRLINGKGLVSDEWSLGFDGDSLWTVRLWVFE